MKRILIPSIGVIALTGYVICAGYVVANQNIESLLVCADQGGLSIPFAKNVCRAYLFNFRGTEQDIADLEQGVGASFVVQGRSQLREREQVLEFLLKKNLNLNNIGMHRLTPLHEAVIANSTDELTILLRHGADTNIKDEKFGLTPLELAVKLQSDSDQVDRRPVVALLESHRWRAR